MNGKKNPTKQEKYGKRKKFKNIKKNMKMKT